MLRLVDNKCVQPFTTVARKVKTPQKKEENKSNLRKRANFEKAKTREQK